MRTLVRFQIAELQPTIGEVLEAQGLPEEGALAPRLRRLVEDAFAAYARLAEPRAVYEEIDARRFRGGARPARAGRATPSSSRRVSAARARPRPLRGDTRPGASGPHPAAVRGERPRRGLHAGRRGLGGRRAVCPTGWRRTSRRARAARGGASEERTLAYSPGYCGWPTSGQRALFAALAPEEVGVTLNDSCLMTPVKSVSGVLVSAPAEAHRFRPDFPFCRACRRRECGRRMASVLEPTAANRRHTPTRRRRGDGARRRGSRRQDACRITRSAVRRRMEILDQIAAALRAGDVPQVGALTAAALDAGLPAGDVLQRGLLAGMTVVGEQFRAREIFLPDVLLAARAMYAGLDLLKPLLASQGVALRGKVVIGTVKGDLHDIGKNLVAIMLRGAGFEVIDLGHDVAAGGLRGRGAPRAGAADRDVGAAHDDDAAHAGGGRAGAAARPRRQGPHDRRRRAGQRRRSRSEIGADGYALRRGAGGGQGDARSWGWRDGCAAVELTGRQGRARRASEAARGPGRGRRLGHAADAARPAGRPAARVVRARAARGDRGGGAALRRGRGRPRHDRHVRRQLVPARACTGSATSASASTGRRSRRCAGPSPTARSCRPASVRRAGCSSPTATSRRRRSRPPSPSRSRCSPTAGADLVCIETMSDLAEAVAAVRAAKRVAPGLPVMATMTFEQHAARLLHGDGRRRRGGRRRARRRGRRRRRLELRQRDRGHGRDRSRDGAGRRRCRSRSSRTPACPTRAAASSSTTRRPSRWRRTSRSCWRWASRSSAAAAERPPITSALCARRWTPGRRHIREDLDETSRPAPRPRRRDRGPRRRGGPPRAGHGRRSRGDARPLPFLSDDYARALGEARARELPLFIEAWAPW